jgi:hypothetical protein
MCGALSVVALFDSFHLIYDANEMRRKMKEKKPQKRWKEEDICASFVIDAMMNNIERGH